MTAGKIRGWGLVRDAARAFPMGNSPHYKRGKPPGLPIRLTSVSVHSNAGCVHGNLEDGGANFASWSRQEIAMLTLREAAGMASDSLASQPDARTDLSNELTPRKHAVAGIDVRSLAAGTEVVVDTRNSRYRFFMLGGGSEALVRGGRYFDQGAVVRIEGSTAGRGG